MSAAGHRAEDANAEYRDHGEFDKGVHVWFSRAVPNGAINIALLELA